MMNTLANARPQAQGEQLDLRLERARQVENLLDRLFASFREVLEQSHDQAAKAPIQVKVAVPEPVPTQPPILQPSAPRGRRPPPRRNLFVVPARTAPVAVVPIAEPELVDAVDSVDSVAPVAVAPIVESAPVLTPEPEPEPLTLEAEPEPEPEPSADAFVTSPELLLAAHDAGVREAAEETAVEEAPASEEVPESEPEPIASEGGVLAYSTPILRENETLARSSEAGHVIRRRRLF